ncbi:uncharacterized protein TNIN_353041 [Trichonephila inaurata madagascariensis]|uniref:Uncharacterized protein n=1 Tax=Trichonephila inaurata madagascariensis TaxID=2747483 RepID=A0A8X7CCE7_9ARAC|nr:uncharacterized protein TNIN_353041 [Trichonephila inaurata madagascariensis]
MTYLPPAEREIECELRHVVSKPVVSPGHLDREKYFLEGNTRLAVRPAERELAQDGVEYRGHVVGLGKQSSAQLKYVILARRESYSVKKIVLSRTLVISPVDN